MAELSGLQVFKYLPAAKRLPEGNCKKCGHPTCMAFALKLAKGQADIELCPFATDDLKGILSQSLKKPQKEVFLGRKNKILVGGENVLFRHDKTFVNKTAIAVVIDTNESDCMQKLDKILNYEISRVNETFKIDLVYLKGNPSPLTPLPQGAREKSAFDVIVQKLEEACIAWIQENDLSEIEIVEENGVFETIQALTEIRKKAVLEKDENYSNPVMIYFASCHPEFISGSIQSAQAGKMLKQVQHDNSGECFNNRMLNLMARASFYLCKYANLLVFEDFDEALISTLMTLRQNIFTDPQKPLQVESKVYEFNNPDENALVFLTTNFALTYFAVANEIEALNKPAYLVVTPSDGMSVLTAWSAEKFTAQIVAKTVKNAELDKKVKSKKIIIPGLLSHMTTELEEAVPDFEFIVGPNEAYLLSDFVKSLT